MILSNHIFDDYYLHKTLPREFKVILRGNVYPLIFQEWDKLTILNFMAYRPCEYLLVNRSGKHEIVSFKEYQQVPCKKSDIIGLIESYERCCPGHSTPILGGDNDEELYPPDECRDCNRLHLLELKGKEAACCMTSRGLIALQLKDVEEETIPGVEWIIHIIATNKPDDCSRKAQ